MKVREKLGFYVYRLIDPRNGETFYVGKGRGNRVFHHASAELGKDDLEDGEDEADLSEKLHRVRQIRTDGLEVIHVIHRHGLTSDEALHVEAALIDAYPGLTNVQGGHGNGDIGAMHAQAVIRKYEAAVLVPAHRMVFVTVTRAFVDKRGLYEGCRGVWRMSIERAQRAELVLPVMEGIVAGVFKPKRWLRATKENFPIQVETDTKDRIGFEGAEAEPSLVALYKGKRLPAPLGKPTQNPVRYWD